VFFFRFAPPSPEKFSADAFGRRSNVFGDAKFSQIFSQKVSQKFSQSFPKAKQTLPKSNHFAKTILLGDAVLFPALTALLEGKYNCIN